MFINDMKFCVKQIITNTNRTPFIWGDSGNGKTQSVEQIAEELGYQLIKLNIATQETGDLIGIPKTREIKGMLKTIWAQPAWFPTEDDNPTIIFCDEANRGREEVQQAMMQFYLEKTLHTHRLASQHKIICAGNPDNSSYNTSFLDRAQMARFINIIVKANLDDFIKIGRERKFHPDILGFVSTHEDMLSKNTEFEIEVDPSPRSYEMASEILTKCNIPDNLLTEILAGILGRTATTVFYKYMKDHYNKPFTAEEILEKYTPEMREKVKNYREDLLSATITSFRTYYADKDRQHILNDNLIKFIEDLPDEFIMSLLRPLITNDKVRAFIVKSNKIMDCLKEINRELNKAG